MSQTTTDVTPKTETTRRETGGDFRISELFFSRTDNRGVILTGNAVFQRVAGFEWNELIGAPHKLVRHPDMPRAVFYLMWDTIKQGKPIGAYVKNRTKSGGYYWVFAVVMPVGDGYLSVRLKPSSSMFEKVKEAYAALRTQEQEAGADLTAEDSAGKLLGVIEGLGFPNYTAFMAAALTAELMARDVTLGNRPDDRLEAFHEMATSVADIFAEANELYSDFRRIEQIPVNLRLQASRCEASGGPVTVISANYSNLAKDALSFAGRFTDFGENVLDQINTGLFLMGAARLQREMAMAFGEEKSEHSPVEHHAEVELLKSHIRTCGDNARNTVRLIGERCEAFVEDSRRMRRFIGGLDVTRVTCRIETGWLPDDDGGFFDIIEKLDAFHEVVEKRMKRIDSLNDIIIDLAGSLINGNKATARRSQASNPTATTTSYAAE